MSVNCVFVIYHIALFALIGFLCWCLQSAWPMVLILACVTKMERKQKDDENDLPSPQ